ncbi:MAG: cupin domain-containing protein [Propionibacteriaceae bacterium]|nr:cupin domain-containing protein [Propionibacteriaceae bacterium]
MKDLIIKNRDDIDANEAGRDGNVFYIKPVVAGADIDTCSAAFIEVPVGNFAFGYHFHDQSEEIFYIVSGTGKLRGADGETPVKAGDMLCFPTGEKGAHVVSNTSDTEPLVFIDFDVKASPVDIVTFPDTGKMMVRGAHVNAMVDVPKS